jgi:hypothetical protein
MIRIYLICEGQTEETYVRDVLSPILSRNNIFITAQMIPTSKIQKGGALSYPRVKRYIERLLKQENNTYVTTFFDLYALDSKFPKIKESKRVDNLYEKVELLETAFFEDIYCKRSSFRIMRIDEKRRPDLTGFKNLSGLKSEILNVQSIVYNDNFKSRFSPYIQPYEFEGLLFSDVAKLIEVDSDWGSHLVEKLQKIKNEFETPEHINNSKDTSPSHRLQSLLKYKKKLHGPLAIENIGIDKVLRECRHFKQWYHKLLNLT